MMSLQLSALPSLGVGKVPPAAPAGAAAGVAGAASPFAVPRVSSVLAVPPPHENRIVSFARSRKSWTLPLGARFFPPCFVIFSANKTSPSVRFVFVHVPEQL